MERRLLDYLNHMQEFTSCEHSHTENQRAYEDLMIQIGFFQHERLVHLLVTLTFAILSIAATITCLFVSSLPLLLLTILLICLLIPYVRHYYILENGVQQLYTRYDYIIAKLHPASMERESDN